MLLDGGSLEELLPPEHPVILVMLISGALQRLFCICVYLYPWCHLANRPMALSCRDSSSPGSR
jgi:hypothetical protein